MQSWRHWEIAKFSTSKTSYQNSVNWEVLVMVDILDLIWSFAPVFHPKDGLVLSNIADGKEDRSKISSALHAFLRLLLSSWYDLRIRYGTEGEYNIQHITSDLAKLTIEWIEVVGVGLNYGKFLDLKKSPYLYFSPSRVFNVTNHRPVLDKNRPGSKIFYKQNDRYVEVKGVCSRPTTTTRGWLGISVENDGKLVAERKSDSIKHAIALIYEETRFHDVFQREKYERQYKELRAGETSC